MKKLLLILLILSLTCPCEGAWRKAKAWEGKPPVGSQIDWDNPLSRGLVGCWLMNEGGGNSLKDIVLNNNGANSGAAWIPSAQGKALNFDGSSSLVTIANESKFKFDKTGAFTISCWIKPNILRSGGAVNYGMISKLNGSSPFEGWEFTLRWDGTKTILNPTMIDTASKQKNVVGAKDLLNSIWWHVVFVKESPDNINSYKAYVNGIADTMTPIYNDVLGTVTNNLSVGFGGRTSGTFRAYTNYSLASVNIYNRALSPSEIQSLYVNPYQFIIAPKRRIISQIIQSLFTYKGTELGSGEYSGEIH